MVSLQDLPKKVQYIIIDSQFVNGTNNTFTIDLTLESNLHLEELSQVCGLKPVDFYITQIGENDLGTTNVAKYVDIICPDIPKRGQILDERNGQILARVPLERSFTGSNDFIMRDKQWKSFHRQTNYFNPISIQKLPFNMYESQGDGDYELLQPSVSFYMVLEVTTIDVKEKPVNKEVQILEALHELIGKIDTLNENVHKLPEKEPEKKKKFSFNYLLLAIAALVGGYIFYVNKFKPTP